MTARPRAAGCGRFVVALLVVLIAARAVAVLGRAIEVSWLLPFALAWQPAAIGLAFAALALGLRRAPIAVAALFWLMVVATAVDTVALRAIATPLTWPMLRAAGGALGDSIAHYCTAVNAALALGHLAVAAVVVRAAWAARRSVAIGACATAILVAVIGAANVRRVDTHGLHRHGVFVLLTSPWRGSAPVELAPRGAAAWRRVAAPSLEGPLPSLRGAARGRNVVLVVLESVAARYLRPWGAAADPMPNLTGLASRGVLFERAYAVYPESIKGLVALWHSVHPARDTEPADYRDLPEPSFAAVLGERGYRTALFHSGRFGYLGMEHVLAGSGFAEQVDAATIGGDYDSSFGVADCDTVDALLRWLDAGPVERPWCVAFLPVSGHHPYGAPERGPFDTGELFGAYQNAIWYADRALGRLIDGLVERGRWANSLLVVVGDHGQAFGQHEANFGHTFFLYDENVHVPWLVVAPGLTDRGERVAEVASHVDLAPTLLDLLGAPVPYGYEGRSLLDGSSAAALMFTDYSIPQVAIVDGSVKCIVDTDSGRTWLFDLAADPLELDDVSGSRRELVHDLRQRAEGWAHEQALRFRRQD